jgi:hypothetical protein
MPFCPQKEIRLLVSMHLQTLWQKIFLAAASLCLTSFFLAADASDSLLSLYSSNSDKLIFSSAFSGAAFFITSLYDPSPPDSILLF